MEKSKKILKVENLKKAYYSTSRTGESITYPVLNNVETQVKVQDANSTLAQASINTALKELGSNATSEEIKKRSLEILNDATLGKSK